MKLSVAALLLLPALSAAFAPAQSRSFATSLNAAAAKSKEEDLEMTRQVIARFFDGDSEDAKEEEPESEEKDE